MAVQSFEQYASAVAWLRSAGLVPTFPRLAVAHVLSQAGRRLELQDVVARAHDDGLPLSLESAREALETLTRKGVFTPQPDRQKRRTTTPVHRQSPPVEPAIEAATASSLLRLLGNPRRRALILRLAQGESTVGTLADHVGLSQSATSQHLARLRAHGLARTRRDMQRIFYWLDPRARRILLCPLIEIAPMLTNVKE